MSFLVCSNLIKINEIPVFLINFNRRWGGGVGEGGAASERWLKCTTAWGSGSQPLLKVQVLHKHFHIKSIVDLFTVIIL